MESIIKNLQFSELTLEQENSINIGHITSEHGTDPNIISQKVKFRLFKIRSDSKNKEILEL